MYGITIIVCNDYGWCVEVSVSLILNIGVGVMWQYGVSLMHGAYVWYVVSCTLVPGGGSVCESSLMCLVDSFER